MNKGEYIVLQGVNGVWDVKSFHNSREEAIKQGEKSVKDGYDVKVTFVIARTKMTLTEEV